MTHANEITDEQLHSDALGLALGNLRQVEQDLMSSRHRAGDAFHRWVEAKGETYSGLRGEGPSGRSKAEIIAEFIGGLPGFFSSTEIPRMRFETNDPEAVVCVRAATTFVTQYNPSLQQWSPYLPFYMVGADSGRNQVLLAQPPMKLEGGGNEDRWAEMYTGQLAIASFWRKGAFDKALARTALSYHMDYTRKDGVRGLYDNVRETFYVAGDSRRANVHTRKLSAPFTSLSITDFNRFNVYGCLTNLAVTFKDTARLGALLEAEKSPS